MGILQINICDWCGKRSPKIKGRLILFKHTEKYSRITERSWSTCTRCFNKITALETRGDKVIEEIEIQIDKLRVQYNQPTLLK